MASRSRRRRLPWTSTRPSARSPASRRARSPTASAQAAKQRAPQQTGMGFDRPATETAAPAARGAPAARSGRAGARQGAAGAAEGPPAAPGRAEARRRQPQQRPPQQDGAERRQRPTRSSLQGERAPGAAGGVRRVVIDSQAARRSPGGPGGGPGGGPAGPQRRPPRRGGRRRRGTYEEPAAQDVASLKADVIKVNSGSTVKDVAEYLGVPIPEIIKKLMSLGEMATLTQTLSDDAIQVLADEFDKEIEIVHAADEAGAEPEFEDADEDLEPRAAGRHDHGPRRPRQDVAAGRDPPDRGGRGRGRRHHPAHRRLPGPPRRQDDHLPRHAGPRGVHRHACPRRPGDRHRGHRGRGRRRREAADARGGRPREGRRGADPRRGQQDRQGGRAARPRPHRDDATSACSRRSGAARRCSSTSRPRPTRTSTTCSSRSSCSPRSRSSRPTRTPRRPAWSSSPSSTRAAAPS